jgi:S-adenosyl-L-methionine hydrolase (adenosine-forming)
VKKGRRKRPFAFQDRCRAPGENAVSQPIITLTTDFGTSDHLVGAMKGVILGINPNAHIVDIQHHVAPFDVLDGALTIGAAYPYFPLRTIHIVIVDPGVGTARRPLLVSADNQYFIAPDNGVLSMVYDRDPNAVVRHVTASHNFLEPVSPTFHGRDVFAPVAAYLSKAWATESFGDEIKEFARFALPKPKTAGDSVKAVVLRVDIFGNLMTNLRAEDLPEATVAAGTIQLQIGTKKVQRFVATFGEGNNGEPVALIGSSGYVEIAVNKGSAAKALGASRGAEIILARNPS